MMAISEFALAAIENNLSAIPIKAGTKKPAISKWQPFQKRTMNPGEIRKHFVNGCQVALVAGSVSGNLECLDFDNPELFQPYLDTLEGVDNDLHRKLTVWQHTPSGGYHILIRCTEQPQGNLKLAMSKPYKDDQGNRRQDVFIETRGQGGYFLVAPSNGYRLHGKLSEIPVVTTDEVDLLHSIARSFTEDVQQQSQTPHRTNSTTSDRPGDRFNQENDWHHLLESEGWRYIKTVGDREHWQRPGKNGAEISATLHPERGLFVFSTSTPLPDRKPLDKFGFYAYSRFNGDLSSAAKSLNIHDSEISEYSEKSEQTRTFRIDKNSSDGCQTVFSNYSDKSAKPRELSKDVLFFIESEPAPFTNNDLYSELCARTREEKKSIANALAYYAKTGKINKIDGKRGHWEVVEAEPEVMDLLSVSAEPFNIPLPLNISEYAKVHPGSVILVSGSSNAGKTVFLLSIILNFLRLHTYPHTPQYLSNERIDIAPKEDIPAMTYLNSEMSAGELANRIKSFGADPSTWVRHVKFIERSHSFDKLVLPDGLTFVDFLEVNEDFFMAGKFIADIHRRLKSGVAVVAMQKKQGQRYAKGGEMTIEKPRLAINLDRNEPHGFICKIIKCKEPVDFMHSIQDMERDFVISGSSEILPISDWRFVNEQQRRQINAEYTKNGIPNLVKKACLDYRTGQPIGSNKAAA
ncbi:bifunctional DNA primase/polymerase [Desulfobulbus rhabdoformis]|uniref:bifunctional DNA primase/polymerase n=1 Tax=Desulfobulbus rhabdoformis TaxID=34032 RepID=UPI001965D746|nr:bifunctional DNA primase/polymerase [Desulfobulbus rhabdoformis]MBM9614767.1 bifunctional DNA primase/polymerase [Desulfobulbus rhabdoformis]